MLSNRRSCISAIMHSSKGIYELIDTYQHLVSYGLAFYDQIEQRF